MANLREETLNTYLATLLDQYDGICATPEIRDGREAIDITVTHSNATAAIPILIEAKIGDSPANRRQSRPTGAVALIAYLSGPSLGALLPNGPAGRVALGSGHAKSTCRSAYCLRAGAAR